MDWTSQSIAESSDRPESEITILWLPQKCCRLSPHVAECCHVMLALMRMLFGLAAAVFGRAMMLPTRNIGPNGGLQNVNPSS